MLQIACMKYLVDLKLLQYTSNAHLHTSMNLLLQVILSKVENVLVTKELVDEKVGTQDASIKYSLFWFTFHEVKGEIGHAHFLNGGGFGAADFHISFRSQKPKVPRLVKLLHHFLHFLGGSTERHSDQ